MAFMKFLEPLIFLLSVILLLVLTIHIPSIHVFNMDNNSSC